MVTEVGAVASLCALVMHTNRDIQKEACWTLSNISAGTVPQIQRVIDSGILIQIVALARNPDVDNEVCVVRTPLQVC
jgi:importin subunit alpha-6/7